MKQLVATFIASLAAVAITGCGNGDGQKSAVGPVAELKIKRVLAEGSQSAFGNSRDVGYVIRSKAKYDETRKRHARGRDRVDPAPWPDVDFTNSDVVAVFFRPGGGGETAQVESIKPDGQTLNIFATLTLPGKGCLKAAVVTHSFVILETKKSSQNPALVVQRSPGPPC